MGNNFDFNQGLQDLENIVKEMEGGKLSLEESLDKFKKGIEISKSCKKALDNAKQQITHLSADNDYQD